jgi:hypothetical protein
MVTARLIVCERTGQWAAAFRRELAMPRGAASVVPLHESRGLADCASLLEHWPGSLAAVEVTKDYFAAALDWTADMVARYPAARIVILSRLEVVAAEWVLREAGAVHIVRSPRHVKSVTQLAVKQLAQAPRVEQSYVEAIMASLPWSV